MSINKNAAFRYVVKANVARRFAKEFGINVPGVKIDISNTDPRYVEAYDKSITQDMIIIIDEVKAKWLDKEYDTRELAKLLTVIKRVIALGNTLLR